MARSAASDGVLATYRYSGGFLGGDIYMHKLKLELVKFQPIWKRHVLGMHAVYEGLAPFGFRPSAEGQPRFASLGMTRRERTLYYCSYPLWRSMAHLMSYNLDTGRVVHHGPVVTDDGRRVSEIHSMATGSDGKLHCAAMVWSIAGKDPAQPWANRAQCYFHARFLVIDPERDLK